ncbi:hypothetical protein Tco_0714075 [Tanacetum coccineum]
MEGENLTQNFTIYKALMNKLVNDGIKLSKLKINTVFINRLPKKWLSFCQSLRNTNHVKDSELASLFGKLKYEENLIDNINKTEKKKSLTTATPLSTAFISTFIVQDFQDSPDDEEDTRRSQEYMNDLEMEFHKRDLLAKSKRFFKKDEEEVSFDDNEMVDVMVLMALADDESVAIGKESARNVFKDLGYLKLKDLICLIIILNLPQFVALLFVGIKSLHDVLEVTAAKVCVTAAK